MELEDTLRGLRLRGAGSQDQDGRRRGRVRARARAGVSIAALRRACRPSFRRTCAARRLTHASWTEDRSESYERLAYLGDSVLALAVAPDLIDRFPDEDAGGLTKIHNQAVSGVSCAEVGRELGVPEMLRAEEPEATQAGDPRRRAAERRAAAARGNRGPDRRLLPRLRLRARRRRGVGRFRGADRARCRDAGRLQVRPAGDARAAAART